MNQKRKERYEKRLAVYEEHLDLLDKAYQAILAGAQSYKIGSRQVTRADLATVSSEITATEKAIEEIENLLNGKGRNKMVGVIPRDF